jgi:hypothetical protein
MKHIHYDGSIITTSDDVADAVLEYAAALGANGKADTVHVPTFDEYGMGTTAAILIGPASAIVIDDAPDDELEPQLDDQEFTSRLHQGVKNAGEVQPLHADQTPVTP